MAKKLETEEVSKNELLKELEGELESKKAEIIKELEEKVEKEVNATISMKMKAEEKRILKGKNHKIIRRNILIIILLAIIGYFGYCLYDVDYFNIRTIKTIEIVNNPEESNEDNEEEQKIDYIKDYGYLVDQLIINDDSILELMVNNKISNDVKLKIGYKNLASKVNDDGVITFTSEDLKEAIEKVFGETDYENATFIYNQTRFMYYDNKYIGYEEEAKDSDLVYTIISGEFQDDELTFEVIGGKLVGKELFDLNDNSITKKYNNDLLKYQDKLSHIKITYSKEDDNFTFKSIVTK